MRKEDVEFLRDYLTESGQFEGVVRWGPPRALWGGRWRRILSARPSASGATLELSGGKRLRLKAPARRIALREPVRDLILELLRRSHPGHRVAAVMAGTDRVRRQSASVLRVLLTRGSHALPVLAAYPGNPPREAERIFSSLALWWDELRRRRPRPRGALVLVPDDWNENLARRLSYLRIPVRCCKYGSKGDAGGGLRQIYPAPPERLKVGAPYALLPPAAESPDELRRLAADDPDLDLTWRFGLWELSYRGLPVAWRDRRSGAPFFDPLRPRPLDAQTKPRFVLHLAEVKRMRRFPAPDPGHPWYQMRPERWLESLLVRRHRLINAEFAHHVHCQVPTCLDGERKVLDLLTATRGGRLAVLELKVEKDLDLVFQALDYWERVEEHLRAGDFQRLGYFRGVDLSLRAPLLYLVCPLFEFHSAMPVLRKSLSRRVRFRCVGLNADWRRGLRVLRRFEF